MIVRVAGCRRPGHAGRVTRRAATLLVLVLMTAAFPSGTWSRQLSVHPGAGDLLADVLPRAQDLVLRESGALCTFQMDVTLDTKAGTIGGDMQVTWHNPASQPLSEVWFRLFPNAFYYGEGGLTVDHVMVDDSPVAPELALDDTALRVPLPGPVSPGDTATIALDFVTTIPADSTGSFGIFSHDTRAGSWVLADWQPQLAVWEDGSGWALPPVTSLGDPTYSPSAFYDVAVTAPDGLQVVATGVVAAEEGGDGLVTRRFLAGPARDFVMVATSDPAPRVRDVDGAQMRFWAPQDSSAATSDKILDIAAAALRFYDSRFGLYPGREIDLVQTNPSGALGLAWTGLIFLDGPALLRSYDEHNSEGLATVVTHEIGHLWWGIMVGGDSNKHAFIQEGLATVSSLLFDEATLGPEAATTQLDAWVVQPARRLLDAGDAMVDEPFQEGEDESARSDAVYGKGSLGFLAIRQAISPEAFDAALRDITTRYAWGEMTPEQLLAAFEDASGQDLHALWRHWFNETGMTREEIDGIAGTTFK